MGNYDSDAGVLLVLTFEICRDKPGVCRSEGEIMKWISNKFLITLENQMEFNKYQVQSSIVEKSSRIVYHIISP